MSKRANGEGTIYKATYKTKTGKEKTRWIGQYYDKDGKRKPLTGKTGNSDREMYIDGKLLETLREF